MQLLHRWKDIFSRLFLFFVTKQWKCFPRFFRLFFLRMYVALKAHLPHFPPTMPFSHNNLLSHLILCVLVKNSSSVQPLLTPTCVTSLSHHFSTTGMGRGTQFFFPVRTGSDCNRGEKDETRWDRMK